MSDESMISIPQKEYKKLLRIQTILAAGECKSVQQFAKRITDSPVADGEFFIVGLKSFEVGDRVVIVKVKSLPGSIE